MCTVSYVSHSGRSFITSNRDEHIGRETAYAPVFESINDKKIIFPKDAKAGGTWFAASEEGVVAVLLNGAFEKHQPTPPYRKSRGLVLLDIISSHKPFELIAGINLNRIEPFTLILYQQHSLTELRWDGDMKHEKELDASGNYIWSSATLYSGEVIQHRKELFNRFITAEEKPAAEAIAAFHSNDHNDEENGFVINRSNGMRTFSITQAVVQPGKIDFRHIDLLKNQQFEETMYIRPALINL